MVFLSETRNFLTQRKFFGAFKPDVTNFQDFFGPATQLSVVGTGQRVHTCPLLLLVAVAAALFITLIKTRQPRNEIQNKGASRQVAMASLSLFFVV